MGATILYGYYPKKCADDDILPYIKEDLGWGQDLNGKHVPDGFYPSLDEYGTHYEKGDCYIINGWDKITEFAALQSTPSDISDYIAEGIPDNIEDPIFILWMR